MFLLYFGMFCYVLLCFCFLSSLVDLAGATLEVWMSNFSMCDSEMGPAHCSTVLGASHPCGVPARLRLATNQVICQCLTVRWDSVVAQHLQASLICFENPRGVSFTNIIWDSFGNNLGPFWGHL